MGIEEQPSGGIDLLLSQAEANRTATAAFTSLDEQRRESLRPISPSVAPAAYRSPTTTNPALVYRRVKSFRG
jgi:hypothetical protein